MTMARRLVRTGYMLAATWTFAAATTIAAQASPSKSANSPVGAIAFRIDAQPIDSALKEFASQANFQLVYETEEVNSTVRSRRLAGTFKPEAALSRLLAHTNLAYKFINARTVSIRSVEALAPSPPPVADEQFTSGGETAPSQSSQFGETHNTPAGPKNSKDTAVSNTQTDASQKTLAEVIVTAQKREERLIDTPQSVSVLTSVDLAKMGAVQFRDFANTVPGLSFTTQGAGYTQVSLRGVTVGADVGPTVGIYVDDVPYGSSSTFVSGAQYTLDVGLFDVDRVEVLRGPQGTLYGASTIGGLIKYVSKRPDATNFSGDTQAGISGTQDGGANYDVSAAVNVPVVTGKVAVRASGFESHDGGYVDNVALAQKDVNRSDVYGGRLDILITPTDALTIRVDGFLQNITRDGHAEADYTTLGGTPLYGSLDQYRVSAEPFSQEFRLASGTLGYDFGAATLTSISSYQTSRAHNADDASGFYAPLFSQFGFGNFTAIGLAYDVATNKFTQEVRLAGSGGKPLEWLIGGFYTHESSSLDFAFVPQPTGNLLTLTGPSIYKESAAFGDLTYHLTSKFDLSGGLRYAKNDQSSGGGNASGLLAGAPTPTVTSSEGVVTYLGNARYHFSDNATGYIRYATGYRPGGPNFVGNGINPITGLPLGHETFQADRLKSYEAGFKAETADRRLSMDIAGYYIDWLNIQIPSATGGFQITANAAGGATVRGTELALAARPNDDFTTTATFAYQDAHLSQAQPDLGGAKGERLPNVPHVTATLNADYVFAKESLRPTVGATLRYVGDRKASFDNAPAYLQYSLPEYSVVDLRTGLVFNVGSGRPIDLQLYVHNLFDERGQLSAFAGYGKAQVAVLQPRTIGINVATHF